jgi:hypothetical protein
MIRSNPDLKTSLVYSPKSSSTTPHHQHLNNQSSNFNNEHYLLASSRSNNLSINTSNISSSCENTNILNINSAGKNGYEQMMPTQLNNAVNNSYYQPGQHRKAMTPNGGDLSSLSNNLSLNLSIHTAEEFGVEMLAWLNNNEANSNLINATANGNANGANLNLANNATLV